MFSPIAPASFSGIQSTFEFGRESQDTGYANKALYLIHYQPSGRVSAQVI
ncbi:MAG: hypothetical protein K2F79_00520 [Muribaculaceae bacterium]|nr:hypothetical protein [Muribaculaceae bacterium]